MPDWLSAAEKLGLAINAAKFGCAASAAQAFWFDDKAASAAGRLASASNARGFAIIAEKACGFAIICWAEAALRRPAVAAAAASDCASNACNALAAPASCAALADLPKADALFPIAAISLELSICALLARLPKASALLLSDEKTRGSAASARIAALSLAKRAKAAAFLAMCAFAAALDAAFAKPLGLLA